MFESVKVAVTKHEFEDFMRFLSMVQGMLDTIYVFGKPPIKEVLSEMMKQGDVTNLIKSRLMTCHTMIQNFKYIFIFT